LNGTHQLQVHIDDVYLLGNNINTIKKNTEALTDAGNEVGLKVSTNKTKHMLMSHTQNVGKNHNIKIANRSFENMAKFKYFGTTATNQNRIHEDIKRLNSSNACYNSVHNLLSSLLSKNIKIKTNKTIMIMK
jgi:hypothetical protein